MSANTRLFSAVALASVVMATSGCVCVTNPQQGNSGDIIFTWNFNGQGCALVPDVTQVAVQIPGQTLQNDGVYGCVNSGTAGIKLLNFRAGTYDYVISGQNAQGTVIYRATGKITVNGDVAMDVTLQPTGDARGHVYVTWSLPAGTPVTCQYIAAVDVSLDMGAPTSLNCNEGATSPGVLFQNLVPGTHIIDISARDSSGLFYYRAINSFQVFAGGATSQQFSLEWIVGSAPLQWTFSNGAAQLNCAQAGVAEVGITLRDAQSDQTFTVPCLNQGVQGYQIPYVYYGDYQVFLTAYGTGGVPFFSPGAKQGDTVPPPQIRVTAGSFPDVSTVVPLVLSP